MCVHLGICYMVNAGTGAACILLTLAVLGELLLFFLCIYVPYRHMYHALGKATTGIVYFYKWTGYSKIAFPIRFIKFV